jgi:dienelactone hydrolase
VQASQAPLHRRPRFAVEVDDDERCVRYANSGLGDERLQAPLRQTDSNASRYKLARRQISTLPSKQSGHEETGTAGSATQPGDTAMFQSSRFRLRHCVQALLIGATALAAAGTTSAQTSPPTSASLNAAAGPLAVATATVVAPRGFGGGTIYYPSAAGRYGAIAISPGFTATQRSVAWLGPRLASHGFVVITINTNSTFDQPASRATQLIAALRHVVNSSGSAVQSRVDPARLAVAGHSMGGGGSLIAARNYPSLKAAYPLTPWNPSTDFSTVRVPTMIIGADGDNIAAVATHARPFYASLPAATDKAYGELNRATHSTPNSANTPIGRYAVSWMKRFVDADTRYSPFLCGDEHADYATALVFDRYSRNCPY